MLYIYYINKAFCLLNTVVLIGGWDFERMRIYHKNYGTLMLLMLYRPLLDASGGVPQPV